MKTKRFRLVIALAFFSVVLSGCRAGNSSSAGGSSGADTSSQLVTKYLVTFKNYDGSVLESKEWEYGSTPSYSGTTPTKPSDAQYSYAFKGWSPEITAVIAAAEYQATYTSTPHATVSIVFAADQNKIGTETFSASEVHSGTNAVTSSSGSSIRFSYDSFYNPPDVWQIIKAGGYFTNVDPIYGMADITLEKSDSSADLKVYWSETTDFTEERSETFDESSSLSIRCDFGGFHPNYLKVVALGTLNSSIQSGSIGYSLFNSYPALTLSADHPEMGSVTGQGIYGIGKPVTVEATPNEGFAFVGWYRGTEQVSASAVYTFAMPACGNELHLEARFTGLEHSVTIQTMAVGSDTSGTCQVSGGGNHGYLSNVTLTATPSEGFGFLGWYQGETLLSYANPYTFVMPSQDIVYVARYSKKYHVSVVSLDESKGTVSGAGDYAYSSKVSITATSLSKGFFKDWLDRSLNFVSDQAQYSFVMEEKDVTFKAEFTNTLPSSFTWGAYPQTVVEDPVLISALDSATDTDSDGYLEYGSDKYVKVTARPLDGYIYPSNSGNVDFFPETAYYFKVEPIQWRVLSGVGTTTGLVLAEKVLTPGCYYGDAGDRTVSGAKVSPSNYQYSTLRASLNGYDGSSYAVENFTGKGFFDTAFSEAEKASIAITTVDNSAATTGDDSGNDYVCPNTDDRLFALSYQDSMNTAYGFSTSQSRYGVLTDYARATGAKMSTYSSTFGNGCWWLRSPLKTSGGLYAEYIDFDGNYDYENCLHSELSVRPSFTLSIG
jgi:hypothetical protein